MRRHSVKLGIALTLTALFALSACGNSNNNNANSPSPASPGTTQGTAAGGATVEVTEKAVNWSFSEPEIKAKVGDTLKLTLQNEAGVHGIGSDDLGVNIKNGETATIKLDKAGTYEFYCNIQCGQGHDNMVGRIIVQ